MLHIKKHSSMKMNVYAMLLSLEKEEDEQQEEAKSRTPNSRPSQRIRLKAADLFEENNKPAARSPLRTTSYIYH